MRENEARGWLDKAEHDLAAGNLLLREGAFTDTICFFAHQTVEKALKGFLTFNDIKPERTHNLIELSKKAKECFPELDNYQSEIDSLNDYYIPSRYPVDPPAEYTQKEAKEALEGASAILELLKKHMAK